MKNRRFLVPALAALAIATSASGADHREAPLIQEDPTADLADVYAFASPERAGHLVLALTVNPFSVPAEAVTYAFSPNVLYAFEIDTNGDGGTDERIGLLFGPPGSDGRQPFSAYLPGRIVVPGQTTAPTEEPTPNPIVVNEGPGGIRIFAGPRDDPFFFDVAGVLRFLDGTGAPNGTDGFAGFNVSAIVVELPRSLVGGGDGDGTLGVSATTARRKLTRRRDFPKTLRPKDRRRFSPFVDLGRFEQVERMGNPAVATVLIPSGQKDLFNVTFPKRDAANWADTLVASLTSLGTSDANIGVLASVAVPDTLKLDLSAAPGFPNGRRLEDDVIDVLLGLITNGAVTGDGVDANDVPFPGAFPYLADPQQAP